MEASFSQMLKMKLGQTSNRQLKPFNFVLNGNFAKETGMLFKAGSVLTLLLCHSEISPFHSADHETALSH